MCEKRKPKNGSDKKFKIVLPRFHIEKFFNLTHSSVAVCHSGYFKTLDRTQDVFFVLKSVWIFKI